MSSPPPEDDRLQRLRWEWLLFLLVLAMSFACVFCSTWLALRRPANRLVSAPMLATRQADYGALSGENVRFAPLNPSVGAQAAIDAAQLHVTPAATVGGAFIMLTIVSLPPTPTPSVTPTPTPLPIRTSTTSGTAATMPAPESLTPTPPSLYRPPGTAATGTAITPGTSTTTPIATVKPTPTAMPPSTPSSPPTFTLTPPPSPPQEGDTGCEEGGNQGRGKGCGQGGDKGGGKGDDKGGGKKGSKKS